MTTLASSMVTMAVIDPIGRNTILPNGAEKVAENIKQIKAQYPQHRVDMTIISSESRKKKNVDHRQQHQINKSKIKNKEKIY